MLDSGRVLTADPFSHTNAGKPWTMHEWLAEVIMALAFRAGGWSGLLLLFGAIVGVMAGLVAAYVRRWLSPLSTVVVLALTAVCVAPSLLARPHIMALACLAGWTLILIRARDRDAAPSLFAVVLMTVWANLHGSFVMGLALIGPFALEALISRRAEPWPVVRSWGLFGLAAVAAALVTPHGAYGLIYPFQLMGMEANAVIQEWGPTDFARPEPFAFVLVAVLFCALWKGLKVPPIRLIILLGLLLMAMKHVRHQPVLGVVGALLLAQPLSMVFPPLARTVTVRMTLPLVRGDGPCTPATAFSHIPAHLRTGPVFNDFGYGGYLIANGVRPFIDGRIDMYGDTFVAAFEKARMGDKAALATLLDRYEVQWTLLAPDTPAVALLDTTPGWRKVYTDGYAVIHVRDRPA